MATYQWRAYTNYSSQSNTCDGNPLAHGVSPNDGASWKTATIGGGTETHTYEYYYSDATAYCWEGADCFCNASSSQVIFNVTETWTTSYNQTTNKMSVSVHTVLNSVRRANTTGRQSDLYGRTITIYRGSDESLAATFYETGAQMLYDHQISGSVDLGTQTITVNPGNSGNDVSTLHIHNAVPPEAGGSYDDIRAGTQFRNTLDPPITYTLNYNANGGSGAPATQTATGIASVTFTIASGTPTWGYYEFLGWSHIQHSDSRTEADVEYRAGDTITLQRANPTMTLYAVWRMDYRPGKTYNSSNTTWWSHDRATGAANIRNAANTGWTTMRTIGGDGSRTGNSPYIRSSSNWVNQRRIGSE